MIQQNAPAINTFEALIISVHNLWVYLLRKWWLISIFAVIGGIFGIMVAVFESPKYESKLTFALEEEGGGLGGAFSLAAEFGINLGGSKNLFEGDNILNLLTSRTIVERTLLSSDTVNGKVITMADYFRKLNQKARLDNGSAKEQRLAKVSFPVGEERSKFTYLQDSVLFMMYKQFIENENLKVSKPDKKLNLYQVSIVSPEERFSKVFTDKLVKEATVFYTELKSGHSREILQILEQRVAQLRGSLNTAITGRALIQDANVNPAFQEAQAQSQKKQVDISTYGGAYGELYKNLELARYQYLRDVPLIQVIDDAQYPMKLIKKGKLQTGLLYAILFSLAIIFILLIKKFFSESLKFVKPT